MELNYFNHPYLCIMGLVIQRMTRINPEFPITVLFTSVNFCSLVKLKVHLKKLFWILPESVIENFKSFEKIF